MPTSRIPLAQPIQSRTASFDKDSRSVNCYFEKRGNSVDVVKRPGLLKVAQVVENTPPTVTQGQGLAEFRDQIISVIDNTVYKTDPTTFVTTTIGTIAGPIEQVWFTKDFLDNNLVFHNSANVYYIDKNFVLKEIDDTSIVKVTMLTGGTGYTTATVHFGNLWNSGDIVTVNDVVYYGANSYIVTAPGTLGGSPPTFTSGSAGSGTATLTYMTDPATATATIELGVIVSIEITNPGSGYIVAPPVTITGDGSPAATASCILNAIPTDEDYVVGTVFLDQYIFIGTCNNRIYNSNLNVPWAWGALDYISFEQGPDRLFAIARHLNYIVAFGEWTMQLFYDAANPTGSPLAVAQSYMSEVGCAAPSSVVQSEQSVFWVGKSRNNGAAVYYLEGTSPVKCSTNNVDRYVQASNLEEVTAYTVKVNGHLFYVLTLHDLNVTIVYDASEKQWYQWTQWAVASNDQPAPGIEGESYFRPCYYAQVYGSPFVLDDDNGSLYKLDPFTYTDDNQPIYYRVVTNNLDSGSTKRKFFGRLEIIGDKVPANMNIRHTGDDYNNWSSYRTVNLNNSRAQIYQSGQDRRRAWEFLCTADVPIRLDSAEIDFKIGELDQEQMVGA